MRWRVFAAFIDVHNRYTGRTVRYRRGDVIESEFHEDAALQQLRITLLPRGEPGDEAKGAGLRKLIAEYGREWRRESRDAKMEWKEPPWFEKVLVPAIDELPIRKGDVKIYHDLPPRDAHGRFVHEEG